MPRIDKRIVPIEGKERRVIIVEDGDSAADIRAMMKSSKADFTRHGGETEKYWWIVFDPVRQPLPDSQTRKSLTGVFETLVWEVWT